MCLFFFFFFFFFWYFFFFFFFWFFFFFFFFFLFLFLFFYFFFFLLVFREDRANSLIAGAQFKVRDGYTGYGRVSFDRSKNDNAVGWAVGVDHQLNENQTLAAVYRSNSEASFQYSNNNPSQKWDAKVACNADFNKDAANRYTLEWKIVFG